MVDIFMWLEIEADKYDEQNNNIVYTNMKKESKHEVWDETGGVEIKNTRSQ